MSRAIPIGLIVVGVAAAIVGAYMRVSAGHKYADATAVNGFRQAMGNPFADPEGAAHWVTVGHWGVGVLVAGLVVALVGVILLAVRRA